MCSVYPCSMLMIPVARKMFPRASSHVLCACAVLFATHPIHTEAVASLVGRAELLMALFALLSFLVYPSITPEAQPSAFGTYGSIVLSVLLAAVSMLCKEQGLLVLLINVAYDIVVVNDHTLPSFLNEFVLMIRPNASTPPDAASSSTDGMQEPVPEAPSTDAASIKESVEPSLVSASSVHFRPLLTRTLLCLIGMGIVLYLRLTMNTDREIAFIETTNRMIFIFSNISQ